ncbi:Cilia- and flagella-associated protein 57 [Entophlyctis luteolus]|nr:Cilia- and flagella-associated protein 57 [Entophlyctis luteolus]
MTSQILTQSHVFGVNQAVSNNVTYIDEQTVLYAAGSQLVFYNTEQRSQRFIAVNDGDSISTLQVCLQEPFAAVAVKSADRGPYVVLVDLQNPRKKKFLMPPDGSSAKEFISVSFTNDSKHILAQTGAPDWTLHLWMWEKTKHLGSIKSAINVNTEVHQMTCNPFDFSNTQICVTGSSMFRTFKFTEGNFKMVSQQKPDKNLLCHCWASEIRVVAGTEDSKFLVFDGGDLILEISYFLPNGALKVPSILWLTSFPAGFMAATSTGLVVQFEKTDDAVMYKKNKEFVLEQDVEVKCITMNPTDESAVCTTSNSQIYLISLDAESIKGEEIKCERLSQPFHHGGISGMDACTRKPLIATCGVDKSIRIWNYMENSMEVIKHFEEEPLRLKFCHTGKVKSISWSSDDSTLTSCSLDGAVFEWSLCTMRRDAEYVSQPTVLFSSVCHAPDAKCVYAASLDGSLKAIADASVIVEVPGRVGYSAILTSRSGKYVFAATTRGTVRVYKSLINNDPGTNNNDCISEIACHSLGISRIRISFDDAFLFTAGEDGCLWIYRVHEKDATSRGAGAAAVGKREKEWTYSDEILVTKSDLRETHRTMQELRHRVESLKSDNDMQLKLKDIAYTEKLRDITDKYTSEIATLKQLTHVLATERRANEENHFAEIANTKKGNAEEIVDMTNAFDAKMRAEAEKHRELVDRMGELKQLWERQVDEMQELHNSRVSEMSEYYRKKIQERQDDILQQQKEFHSHLEEIEQDADAEVLQIGFSFETKLKSEREALSAIKTDNVNMRAHFEKLTKEIEENKSALNKMFLEEKRLHGIIKGLEKDIVGVKREMQERDDTIQDKEKRIYDLKKKNQELEKFKFVLDYKIAELKKQVEPREKDIVLLSRQIKEMDEELHQYQKTHDLLDTQIQDLLLKLKATQQEVSDETCRVHDMKAAILRIQNDTRFLSKLLGNSADLKRNLVSVYHKFSEMAEEPSTSAKKSISITEDGSNKSPEALEEEVEEARQREHFERTAATLNHKLTKGEESRYQENLRIMHENVVLLTEINILRKDLKASKLRTQRLLAAVEGSDLKQTEANLMKSIMEHFKETTPASEPQLPLLKPGVTKPLSLPALHNK